MAKKLTITLDYTQSLDQYMARKHPEVVDFRILSKSLDARGANRGKTPRYEYVLECLESATDSFEHAPDLLQSLSPESLRELQAMATKSDKPVIVGMGPAGLFCALRLLEYGIPSIILEKGSATNKRMLAIARFWRRGVFDQDNNVCYGEGGAGLFSDGKLITRVKSPLISYVMNRFVDFGAPAETAYLANPHLGSNKIRQLITRITRHLIEQGCELHYENSVTDLIVKEQKVIGVRTLKNQEFYSPNVVLATGHSSRAIFDLLKNKGIAFKAKDFALGVRIEHKRQFIDEVQYGRFAQDPELGAARYRLSYHDETTDYGTYSFCMCPGGYVLSSGTETEGLVVNGMSNSGKSGPWTNSALVVTVKAERDFTPGEDNLGGVRFQAAIEEKAFQYSRQHATGREIPTQGLGAFMQRRGKSALPFTSSCPSGTVPARLEDLLPGKVTEELRKALEEFDHKMKGFSSGEGLLLAPETRTSSPIQVMRDKVSLESSSHSGLYPCGEGAGHAGGITSAAVDGVKVADSIVLKFVQNQQ
jgi:uncharacterized FAD-dependent dehydrogenase